MDNHSAFQVAVIVQLLLINFVMPWYCSLKTMDGAKALKSNFGLANLFVICFGIPVVFLVYSQSLFEKTQLQLAALGALFAAQMLPLLLLKKILNNNMTTEKSSDKLSLPIKQVQRIVAVIFLFSIVAITYFTALDGEVSWLKLGILSGACALLYILSRRALNTDKSNSGNNGIKQARILLIMIALLSIYWTLKEVIFATNSHELRPIMMSLFMQGTALITLPNVIAEALNADKRYSFDSVE